MQKILTIARREYQAMVGTKAFLFGLAMMPILMLGGMLVPKLLSGLERSEERTIAVVDRTGELLPLLQAASEEKNRLTRMLQEGSAEIDDSSVSEDERRRNEQKRKLGVDDPNTYVFESVDTSAFGPDMQVDLSDRIRKGELYAFVEIPADLTNPPPIDISDPASLKLPAVRYYSQDAALSDARRWLERSLNEILKARRLTMAGVAPDVILELNRRSGVEAEGLFERNAAGEVVSESKPDELTSLFLPMGLMMLMFMIVMMSAQPMMESVLEEKSQKISEVLLGSANANQLMAGKLLGNVGGSLTVFAVYAAGALGFAAYNGYFDLIPFHVLPWFIVFQVLAVLMFSSVFMAIGSCVNQLKEAQSLLLPVWLLMLLPLMVWLKVVQEPNSMLATSLSLFPPSAPLMMTLRLATGATIPSWQIFAAVSLLIAATCLGVIAAARIYRVGILWQGKTPTPADLLKWVTGRISA